MADTYRRLYIDNPFWAPRFRANRAVLRALLAELAPGSTWLDLCCGQGWHFRLAPPTVHCVGVDASDAQLSVARAAHPEARLVQRDISDLSPNDFPQPHLISLLWASYGYLNSADEVRRLLQHIGAMAAPEAALYLEVLEPTALEQFNTSSFAIENDCVVDGVNRWAWNYSDACGYHQLVTPALAYMLRSLGQAGFSARVLGCVQTLHQVVARRHP